MIDNGNSDKHSPGDWDVYWRGTHENAAHQEGGAQEEILAEFWSEVFTAHADKLASGGLLDLASGNGAVLGHAGKSHPGCSAVCVDYSVNALRELKKRYPTCLGVAADAARLPFENAGFGLISSQFGIEYAGIDALPEAGRLVAPGGVLALVLHLEDGVIYDECALNLKAVQAIEAERIMPLARSAFTAGYALNRGSIAVAEFKEAEKRFTPAVRALEQLLRDMGSGVAAGLGQQLYRDIAHMYQRLSAYDEADIINWIDGMAAELDAYAGRMSSMLAAAVNEGERGAAVERFSAMGLEPVVERTLNMGPHSEPGAWALVLQRK